MGGYLTEGFGVRDRVLVENSMKKAGLALSLATKTVYQVKADTSKSHPLYREWFGAATPTRAKYIYEQMFTMDYALNSATIKLRRVHNSDSVAAAQPPESGWANKSVKQIIESGKFVMNLHDPYFQEYHKDRGGSLGPIKTFIHELSHIVAETNEPIGTYPEVYGITLCKALALNNPDHAIHNADTWGYFCIAHLEQQSSDETLGAVAAMFG